MATASSSAPASRPARTWAGSWVCFMGAVGLGFGRPQKLLLSNIALSASSRDARRYTALKMESLNEDQWKCAFCGAQADRQTLPSPLCESRTCSCGAIALAAPARDYDEITDDAIGLFSVQIPPDSTGYEHLLRRDILQAGIEIRQGAVRKGPFPGGRQDEIQYVWFRRGNPNESA